MNRIFKLVLTLLVAIIFGAGGTSLD